MMAAFIVAIRGTVGQAVLLGLSATISHTAIVWAVALGGLAVGQNLDLEADEPYFQLASAAIMIAIAIWMAWRTWAGVYDRIVVAFLGDWTPQVIDSAMLRMPGRRLFGLRSITQEFVESYAEGCRWVPGPVARRRCAWVNCDHHRDHHCEGKRLCEGIPGQVADHAHQDHSSSLSSVAPAWNTVQSMC